MKTQINWKSCVAGLLLGLVVTLSLGAAGKTNNPVGRFQIAVGAEHSFILDTATGRVWLGRFAAGIGSTDQDFLRAKVTE